VTEPDPLLETVRVKGPAPLVSKVAVTFLSAFMVRLHVVAVPVHAPDQLAKVDPLSAAAVRVTAWPSS
jgi:hypothetical protein